ncbi:hypothetical protein [Fredinandcohnia sp. 179-A 10B2 NHS]|uniref:hypothetical protein n=1 Tax=Fredinandcohnia sp. 179-A 10B2 NHS TaxID=3235176 RepID=UPI0039A219C1
MYRFTYNGQEVIIRFTSTTQKIDNNKEFLYKKIMSISDKIINAAHGTSFVIVDDIGRLVVGTVERGELLVISVRHIIDKNNVFVENITM